jgi:hypothetical protein
MRLARLAAILAFVPLTSALHAATIDFTEIFTGSVTVGSTTYNNKTITLYGVGNTSAVTSLINAVGDPYFLDSVAATFSISGGPSGTFTDQLEVYSDNYGDGTPGAAGFASTNDQYDIMGTLNNTAFADYGLNASIGPISGTSESNAGGGGFEDPTNKGLFSVSSVSGNTSFQAVTTNVPVSPSPAPEPSSLALLGTGVLGIAGMVRRRYARV